MTLSLFVQLFQWKPPGVPVIEQPTFYWKLIFYCSFKPVNDITVSLRIITAWLTTPVCCCEHGEVA